MRPLKRRRGWARGNRFVYALERLWLRRPVRLFVRVALPAATAFLVAHSWLTRPGVLEGLQERYLAAIDWVENRPEFRIRQMRITGASAELQDDIREILGLDFPASMLTLDLDALEARVAALDAVASARLTVREGVLEISVLERVPAVIWQRRDGLELLDAEGHRVGLLARRALRADLPLLAGEGADRAVPEALGLIEAAGRLAPRIRALIRIGERRWDMLLENGVRISLPEKAPRAALARLLVLDRIHDLLARRISRVDLRVAERPVVRVAPEALPEVFPGMAPKPAVMAQLPSPAADMAALPKGRAAGVSLPVATGTSASASTDSKGER